MSEKEIRQAIADGWTVVLKDDPMHYLTVDVFGCLVVDTRRNEDFAPRKATLGDKRRACLLPKRKQNR